MQPQATPIWASISRSAEWEGGVGTDGTWDPLSSDTTTLLLRTWGFKQLYRDMIHTQFSHIKHMTPWFLVCSQLCSLNF